MFSTNTNSGLKGIMADRQGRGRGGGGGGGEEGAEFKNHKDSDEDNQPP